MGPGELWRWDALVENGMFLMNSYYQRQGTPGQCPHSMNVKNLKARMANSLSSKCGSSAFLSLIPGISICLIIQSEIWNSFLSTPFLLGVSNLSISLPQPSKSSPQKRRFRKAWTSTLLSFNNLPTEAFQEVEFTDVAGYHLSSMFSIHNCPKPVTSSIPSSSFILPFWVLILSSQKVCLPYLQKCFLHVHLM